MKGFLSVIAWLACFASWPTTTTALAETESESERGAHSSLSLLSLKHHGVPDFGADAVHCTDGGELADVLPSGPDARGYVCEGKTITVTKPTTLKVLAVAGTLDVRSELKVQTLLCYPGSTLKATDGAAFVIRDLQIDKTEDPSEWGNGVIAFGAVYFAGTPRKAWLNTTADLRAGETVIPVEDSADWRVGDEVVIPDVRTRNTWQKGWRAHERRRIRAIGEVDGEPAITLDAPLTAARKRPRHLGTGEPLAGIPIINLTRGIVVRSENPDGVRGHFACVHRADVRIHGTAFSRLGRTRLKMNENDQTKLTENQIGRYGGPHLHHLLGPVSSHNGYQWELSGLSVHDVNERGWGIVVHQTHYGRCSNSAVWDGGSSGVVTEDGPEIMNEFTGIVSGDAFTSFWFVGPRNFIRGNLAIDTFIGYEFGPGKKGFGRLPAGYPPKPGADLDEYVPVENPGAELVWAEFSENSSLATLAAFVPWPLGREMESPADEPDLIVRGHRACNSFLGTNAYHNNSLHMIDCLIHDEPIHRKDSYGVAWSGKNCTILKMDRVTLMGQFGGLFHRPRGSGSRAYVRDCEFYNTGCIGAAAFQKHPRWGDVETYLHGCKFHPRKPNDPEYREIDLSTETTNIIPNRWFVTDHNGDPAADFRLYFLEQRPDYVFPDSRNVRNGYPELIGLTNQQAWDQFGNAICGAVSPTSEKRPLIQAFVGPLDGEPEPPPQPDPDPEPEPDPPPDEAERLREIIRRAKAILDEAN